VGRADPQLQLPRPLNLGRIGEPIIQANAEDHLEAAARRAETSFEEHTAVPEARLEKAEDDLEAAAHRVDTQAAERNAQVRERISQAREHVTQQHQ
jgi:hypothetical protein